MNMKKILNKKILIIIGVCLIVIIILFFLFIYNKKNNEISINKKIDIDIGGYNQVVNVKSLSKDNEYVKIYVEIENKKNIDSVTSLHQFRLIGSNEEEITMCYHAGMIDTELPNVLPNKLIANGITSGYLYCPIIKDYDKLKITVIAGGKIDDDNNITYEYKDYYIDLK